ncbi:PTS transporter subunit EIIB [Oceanivirga miroungae]|uniref:PTS system beta-glucoside-specific transporter subunit IIABC n=1 Tax=Oceanivirga miroungae TaxID=1130046 RepID=A0A6I8MD04_9FUSO|nr:PTS transporter subunit EIIB [Oceanivirga miroungae]VWL85022.1 PTS system beta-glucoside-specific transporter subunit IIABC [Oceanivirga miroungae]
MFFSKDYKEIANEIFKNVGGKENIVSLDNCSTRVRVEVKNIDKVDIKSIVKAGAKEVLISGEDYLQIVVGPTMVAPVTDAIKVLYYED